MEERYFRDGGAAKRRGARAEEVSESRASPPKTNEAAVHPQALDHGISTALSYTEFLIYLHPRQTSPRQNT